MPRIIRVVFYLSAASMVLGCFTVVDPVEVAGDCRLEPNTECPGADLSGFDLRNLDLSRANFAGADLTGAWLDQTDLSDADLTGANLSGALLRDARASHAVFDGADLTGANLRDAYLFNAELVGANLEGAVLDRAALRQVNFQQARFTGASLRGAELHRSALADADLSMLDFSGADLSGADLQGANLVGSSLFGSVIASADLKGADLSFANLSEAVLNNSDLEGTTLTGANISQVESLKGALLVGQDLRGRDLSGVDFTDVDLTRADLGGANLRGADIASVLWDQTRCPDGSLSDDQGGSCCYLIDFVGDGLDQDCDGIDGSDFDGDGIASIPSGGLDCDDSRALIGTGCQTESGSPEEFDWRTPDTHFDQIEVALDRTNALGPLMDTLFSFIGLEVNPYIASRVNAGDIAMGASWQGLDSGEEVALYIMQLVPHTGGGFLAKRDSFAEDSKTPISQMSGTLSEDGTFQGDLSDRISMTLPFGDALLDVDLRGATITAKIERHEDGVAVFDATLDGFIDKDPLFDNLNRYMTSEACDCLGLTLPPIEYEFGEPFCSNEALNTDVQGCIDAEQPACANMAQNCSFLTLYISQGMDLDTDNDEVRDAISARLNLRGNPTQITGPMPR